MSAAANLATEKPPPTPEKPLTAPQKKPLSLNTRVSELEERLSERRTAIAARAKAVVQGSGQKLSSPVTLLFALGGGIALGYFTRTRLAKAKSPGRRVHEDRPEVVVRPSLVSTLLDAFTLVTTVLAMIPSFAAMVQSFRRTPNIEDGDPR